MRTAAHARWRTLRAGLAALAVVTGGVAAPAFPALAAGKPASPVTAMRPVSLAAGHQAVPGAATALAGDALVDSDGSVFPLTGYCSRCGVVAVHPRTGVYQVVFTGLAFAGGGDVQLTTVTSFSFDPFADPAACTIGSWLRTGPVTVNVYCYNTAGNPVDASFYVLATQPVQQPAGVLDYAWVPSTGSGTLTGLYQYNSSNKTNSVTHLGTGQYLVTMPGPAAPRVNTGTVKVSAYGTLPGTCQLAKWTGTSTAQLIYVDCFTPAGAPQDRRFTVAYARGNNLMGQNGLHDANALANRSAALYQPQAQYDSNPGARITIVHLGTGIYQVLPVGTTEAVENGGLGDIQATPISGSQRACTTQQMNFTPQLVQAPLPINVIECFTGRTFADTAFTVQWVVP